MIFFEAIGHRDPDRAIRKHLARKRKHSLSRQFNVYGRDAATGEIVKMPANK
jgi:hypothetical protein